ncbi:MAG: hypothetical protein A3G38_04730 [Omnitrophica WOR_2 bacterium RIFCSPLOWO2_12_FULL_51_8]|nr:MAG: hypothetical protein A3G38_04730 [Omnitrophica WOR_2 bacterium RIFCSPLOWO2_12_FULL_51_8]
MNSLGIYFGPKAISMVETEKKKVKNHNLIPQAAVYNGELDKKVPAEVKTIEIIALLKDELRRNKMDAREATICLSGRDLIIRTFQMPVLPRQEMQSAINFEAKKYIPFKIEEVIADFQIKLDRLSHTSLVLYIGIKKETLDRHISILNQLDLKINAVEYSAFSILRCLKLAGLNGRGVVGVLAADLKEEDEINFMVLEDGFPLFSRDISLTAGHPEPQGKLPEKPVNIPEALEKLKNETRVSLDYYHRKFPTKTIKKMYLLSCQESRQDIVAFITELGFAAHFIDIAQTIDKSVPYALTFLKAYCASLSRVLKAEPKLNLLAARERLAVLKEKTGEKDLFAGLRDLRLDFRVVSLSIAICLSTFIYGSYQKRPLQKELADIRSARVQVASVGQETGYDELVKEELERRQKIENLDKLVKKQFYLTDQLNIIPRVLPAGVWLTQLTFRKVEDNRAELTLQGRVYLADSGQEIETVNKFVSNLKGSPDFTRYYKNINIVSLDRAQFAGESSTSFVVTCGSSY